MSYAKLAKRLDEAGVGAPSGEELERILEELFTPEEARVGAALPFRPTPLRKVAAQLGVSRAQAGHMLEGMADKGLVFARHGQQDDHYALLPALPGIFELQFMKGDGGPRQTWLARLYEQYYVARLGPRMAEARGTSYARVIPVARRIPNPREIFPYEEVTRYIAEGEGFALTRCHCRHQRELIGQGCDAPQDVCMLFGPFAAFAVERGFARAATRVEMLDALERSEAYGLVHVSDNVAERINFLCNCCGCCCGFLRAAGQAHRSSIVATSRFVAAHEEETCTACGLCLARCQVGALREREGAVVFEAKRCLGCGICLPTCPVGALTLAPREDFEPPLPTRATLEARVKSERHHSS